MNIFTKRIDEWIFCQKIIKSKKKWLRCPVCSKMIFTTRETRTCRECLTKRRMARNFQSRKMGIKKERGRPKGGAV